MAITPAWVRLRDTGRDEPQSVLHCKFLQYTTVPRYRIFFFGRLGDFGFRDLDFPPGGIRIVSAQLAARPARARAPRGRAGRRWRLAGEPRGGGHPRMAACASGCERQGHMLHAWTRPRDKPRSPCCRAGSETDLWQCTSELGPLSSVVCHSHN